VIDTATLSLVKKVTVGPTPTDVVLGPDRTTMYVNSASQKGVWVIDLVKDQLIESPSTVTSGGIMGLTVF
jgi:DNA-binding beta-propeller fold protein YncE